MTVPTGSGRRIRLVAVVSVVALLASTVGASATPVFDDVDDGSTHGPAIADLSERGILLGKTDTTFDPAGTLTRAQLASILARTAGLEPSDDRPFSDVTGGTHAGTIGAAHAAGLIEGYADGTFRPAQAITRDQIALLLYRWLDLEPVTEPAFTDLDLTSHDEAINALAEIGVAQGKADDTFDPRASLRRDQAASFVSRAIAYQEDLEPTDHPWDAVGEDVLDMELPDGDISGVDFHGTVEVEGTSAVNPVSYELGETLVTTGRFGMRIYDLRDRYEPKLIGTLDRAELALPGDNPENNYHTAESLNIDKERKLAFLSRDPRAFGRDQATGPSGFYIIDIEDPTAPELIRYHEVGAGHTTTCVNDCQQVWSGGPARAALNPDDWVARPIFVTDVSDPNEPFTYPEPVDIGRYRGITDYAHDVQVDQEGIAWVSGRGGVRGYWTDGVHLDPVTGEEREAFAHDPVPYAGGEVGEYNEEPERLLGAIHNMERPVDGEEGESAWTDSERPRRPDADDGADLTAGGYDPGELVYVTDENFTSESCSTFGKFYIASIAGSDEGQAWRSAEEVAEEGPYALEELSSWGVADKEGSTNSGTCSAHYFNIQDGVVAGGWYSQGFRFLDVSDPTDPIQIAYFRPDGGSGWSTHWIDEVIYANDINGGIHILTLDGDAATAVETRSEVLAPQMTEVQLAAARETEESLEADPVYGWSCALPSTEASSGDA